MFKFDCHAHVYETVDAIPNARYIPTRPAPLTEWQQNLDANGLTGGVIVQVSFLGTDNSQLCAALAGLDQSRFAGVAVVSLDVSNDELARLKHAGVRGVRWNLIRGVQIPDLTSDPTQAFFEKLRANDLHLDVQLEGPRLAPILPTLADQGVKVVIDHFGLPSEPNPNDDPLLKSLTKLSDRKTTFCKFSAHYRTPFDVRPHAQEVIEALSDEHIIWGSDWPHTQHESPTVNSHVHQMSAMWGSVTEHAAVQNLFAFKVTDEVKIG